MAVEIFKIWMTGIWVQGMHKPSEASFVGSCYGNTFREACINWFTQENALQDFNEERLSYWGCRLYPTFEEANQWTLDMMEKSDPKLP